MLQRFLAVTTLTLLAGCNLVNPDRPNPQPDTVTYGNLVQVTTDAEEPDARVVHLKVGPPRALESANEEEGRPIPPATGGLMAEVTVDPDTVVLANGRPASLEAFRVGAELVAVPVPGTTRMIGVDRVLSEASYLMDFATYRRWRLPLLAGTPEGETEGDPARINSPGVEHSPVPLDGGRVLYFAAHLRPPWKAGGTYFGARRAGLLDPTGKPGPAERSFRTRLTARGWTTPKLVKLPGFASARVVRVSWVNEAETSCLVTVREGDGKPWIGRAERAAASQPWGNIERLGQLGEGSAADAVYLAGSKTMIAFAGKGLSEQATDLFLFDPKKSKGPLPLDPRINTPSREWCPRVGPTNQLFFCRGDRQMIYTKGVVRPLRLPGKYRQVLTEANPTRDGKLLFFCRPNYTPGELDQDLYVAAWHADGSLGAAVPVDDWRPAASAAK